MPENKEKMPLPKITSLDDMFTTQEERDTEHLDKIQIISRNKILPFPDHPFKVNDDEKMLEMVESIKEYGVLVPAIIRPKEDGNYEMIAGHRRQRACELAELDEMPCIVKNLTDDEAIIIMVDSNLQREEILPSEKAFAYKMKLEAMKRQGQRNDLTSTPVVQKLENSQTSVEKMANESGESREQIRRYIRLTELIPEILDMVDEKKIAFRPAVEMSYLSDENQYALLNYMEAFEVTPSLAQAIYMKKLEQENRLTTEKLEEVMGKEKANQIPKIRLNEERFDQILPKHLTSTQQKEDYIFHCVEVYVNRQKQKNMSR